MKSILTITLGVLVLAFGPASPVTAQDNAGNGKCSSFSFTSEQNGIKQHFALSLNSLPVAPEQAQNCVETGEMCQQFAYSTKRTCLEGCSGTPSQCNRQCEDAWWGTYRNCMWEWGCAPIIYQ